MIKRMFMAILFGTIFCSEAMNLKVERATKCSEKISQAYLFFLKNDQQSYKNIVSEIETLLNQGIEIDKIFGHGGGLLHQAVYVNLVEVIRLLLKPEYKADINIKNIHKQTALLLACELGKFNAAKVLLGHDADQDATENYLCHAFDAYDYAECWVLQKKIGSEFLCLFKRHQQEK